MTDADEPTYTLPHDSSNALILQTSGRKKNPTSAEEKKRSAGKQKPRLSNKKLKLLKKVLERKQKRFSRIEVLEKLSKNRIGQDEINLLTSVAHMQDKAKRKFVDSNDPVVLTTNSISGSKRKKYLVARDSVAANRHSSTGPYFETDSSSSEDNDLESTFKEDETIGPIKSTESNNEDVHKSVLVLEDHKETDVATNEVCKNNIKQKPLCAEDDKLKEKPIAKRQPVVHVPLQRTVEIQESRLKLPILGMEQEIMETINDASVVVVCGETGSGKTTQVPQFLYEAGYCSNGMLIGITEPRRVAAMSMSRRVAEEMNLPTSVVSYQIRYEGNVTKDTKIKFLTDGVLLKEIKNDFLLKAYSVVIIDEAHERSMYSDILIGLLSRIVLLREKRQDGMVPPLKLIIMSATLRVDDFLSPKLFKNRPPSVVNVESRQYPVTVHFNKRTEQNFLMDAYKKCCKIHRTLPEGGILVFVSGQREVHTLVTWLTSTFPMKLLRKNNDELAGGDNFGAKRQRRSRRTLPPAKPTVSLDSYRIEDFDVNETDAADYDIFDEEMDEEFLDAIYDNSFDQPLYCLPMYSLLSAKKQAQVFEPVPSGCRLCVVATNVAETSLTIPNVKYVVDTGKEKVRSYDGVTGVSKFVVQWISKASAEQRTGRAGRVCPGQCYRLYSSAVFNEFQQFSTPEIVDKPIDELVLTMKNMNILKVCNFPFPTSPDENVLRAAEERLVKLGALQRRKPEDHAKMTDLGRTMALFPVLPAYGKIICLAHQHKLLSYIIRLVAALSVREPLINLTSLTLNSDKKHANSDDANVVENEDDKKLNDKILEQLKIRREWSSTGEYYLFGDFQVLLRAVLEAERNGFDEKFCAKNGLRQKAMLEISKMCKQLRKITKSVFPDSEFYEDTTFGPLPTPGQDQTFIMRRIFAAGLLDNFSVKHPDAISGSREEKRRLKNSYQCANKMKDPVFIHPTSVLRRKHPDYVLYHDIVDSAKKYMSTVMAVSRDWIDPVVLADVTFQ